MLLLASATSLAWSGAAFASNSNNTTPQSGTATQFTLGSGDSLTNSSSVTITSGPLPAVRVSPVSAGTITNTGTIASFGSPGTAISVDGTLSGISNSGLIAADGNDSTAIDLPAGSAIGTLLNQAGGTISANGANGIALNVVGAATSVQNGGLIRADGGNGTAVRIAAGGSVTAVTNAAGGTIQATGSGGQAIVVSGALHGLTNSGVVQGNAAGLSDLGSAGSISNSGTVAASNGAAVSVAPGASLTSLDNSGLIRGAGAGVANAGSIGGISNAAGAVIQGGSADGSGVAIDNTAGGALTIDNAGTIIGAIRLGPSADTLNVTGGAITGAITGQGTTDTLNYAIGNDGSFTTHGSIAGVSNVGVASGTVSFQNAVQSALAFDIAAGATAMLNPGAPIGAVNFTNAGAVSLGSNTASIAGNYTQTGSGTEQVTVGNGAHGGMTTGRLTVSGTASILATTNAVAANVPLNVAITPLINQSSTVLSAATLSVANAASLTASSNNDALYFTLSTTPTALLLTAGAPTFDQSLSTARTEVASLFAPASSVTPPTANTQQTQDFIASVLAGLSSTGNGQVSQDVRRAISSLSPLQLARLQQALAPSTLTTETLNRVGISDALGHAIQNIELREDIARSQGTGLAAGDPTGRGMVAWVQPFASFLNQDAQDGVSGYSSHTYGASMGGDTLVMRHLRLGLALTLGNNDVNYNDLSSGDTASTFSAEFGAYGTWTRNNFFVDGLLSFGYDSFSSKTSLVGLGKTRKADYNGTQFAAKVGAGYDFKLRNAMVVTPYASLQQVHLSFGSYTTTGGYPFNMHVDGQSENLTQTGLGVRLTYPVKASFGTLRPEVHANWFHTFGSNQVTTTYVATDTVTPGTFSFVAPSTDRDTFNLGFGVRLTQSGPWTIGAGYDLSLRSSSTQHTLFLRAKYRF